MSGQASNGRSGRSSIVLASREVWPFVEGGGIGRCVWAVGSLLAGQADVTVLTSARWRERHAELAAAGDKRLPHGVRFAFVDEPTGDLSPFVSWHHLWSLRLLQAAARLHPQGGPDVLEVADYQAEGFAAAHARRGLDPRLRNTTLAVRLATSAEMCAALNDESEELHGQVLAGLERFPLRFADALLWPGGNSLERYSDFYGEGGLAPAVRCPLPLASESVAPSSLDAPTGDGPPRLLYLNRLERRKGIAELVTAVRSLPDAKLELTIVGRDTMSGPDGGSMRAHVEELAAGDPRIALSEQVPHAEVPALIAGHHAVVIPTRWETFSYVAREALACNRPVLATPAGGIVDVVRPEESGWLARSSSPEDLAAALRDLLDAPEAIDAMIAERRPRAVFDEGGAQERNLEVYRELCERPRPKSGRAAAAPPSVEALVACESAGADPLPTLRSLERQRGVAVGAVLVAEPGVSRGQGPALARAGRVVSAPAGRRGRPGIWAAGLAQTSRELVLLLAAGATLAPAFTERAAAALQAEPALAYVTAPVEDATTRWHVPLGSFGLPVRQLDASASPALARRSALLTVLGDPRSAPEDEMELFGRLADAGLHGLVLQEPLVRSVPRRPATQDRR